MLFPRAMSYFQSIARQQFTESLLGQVIDDVGAYVSEGSYFTDLPRVVDRYASQDRTRLFNTMGQSPFFAFVGDLVTYSKRGNTQNLSRFLADMGPAGELVRAIINADTHSGELRQQLKIAASLLRAFGGTASLPWDTNGNDFNWTIESARRFLEEAGYHVTPNDPVFPVNPLTSADDMPYMGTLPYIPDYGTPYTVGGTGAGQTATEWGGSDTDTTDTGKSAGKTPVDTGEWVKVTDQNIHSFAYDRESHDLYIRYNYYDERHSYVNPSNSTAPGALYRYSNVPIELARSFYAAKDRSGQWLWDNIRVRGTWSGHHYQYDLVSTKGGYVPRKSVPIGGFEAWVPRVSVMESSRRYRTKGFRFAPRINLDGTVDDTANSALPNRGFPDRPDTGSPF